MSTGRLLVMRPAAQAAELSVRLREVGYEPVEVPAIEVRPPASFERLDAALAHLDRYDWIIATSRNAVEAFFERLRRLDGAPAGRPQWAAIGPATGGALSAHGVNRVWIPSRFTSEALAEELPARPRERVLRLRAEAAAEIAGVLRARGLDVDEVVAYRTVEAPASSVPRLVEAWKSGVDGVILTSPSTVRGFLRLAEAAGIRDELPQMTFVAIGPVTAAAAAAAGLAVGLVAEEYSAQGIVRVVQRRGTDGH